MSAEGVPDAAVDLDGLLCALVIAPSTLSRNRHFRLYQDPRARAVQRRSRIIRGLVRELLRPEEKTIEVARGDAAVDLLVEFPSLGFRRKASLSPLEHDLVEYLLARSRGGSAGEARVRVERALLRLSEPARGTCSDASGT